ncbi:MAG: thymidine kinase [Thermoanaerobaculia bacterium]
MANNTHSGWIEVICGSMFSGKSEELIRRLRRAMIARQKVQIFKPRIDSRFGEGEIVSHSEMRLPSEAVGSSEELLSRLDPETEVVGVDEVQFFDPAILAACDAMANQGKRVIVAGLDKDYRGVPFEPIPSLMAIAEDVTKTRAICVRCGSPANYTQRLVESEERVVVGAQGVYEARCRRCFGPPAATRPPEKS